MKLIFESYLSVFKKLSIAHAIKLKPVTKIVYLEDNFL